MNQIASASGVSALRYSSVRVFLPVTEVDGALQLGELGQRGEVGEVRTPLIGPAAQRGMLPSSDTFQSR